MKHLQPWTIGWTAFALTTTAALADWCRAAELNTTGGAKEVSTNFQNVQAVQLQWLDGEVDILVFGVRSVGEKKEFLVERRLDRGETIDFALDGRRPTGMPGIFPKKDEPENPDKKAATKVPPGKDRAEIRPEGPGPERPGEGTLSHFGTAGSHPWPSVGVVLFGATRRGVTG